jgi:NAD(P)-dependent dehydrogenase (short-subunit alcohol dehydrogenase family)
VIEDLSGRVAVVTGAASGNGRATATAFASAGMSVVLADIEEKALDATARTLTEAGASVMPVVTDVSNGASMDALADRAYESFGAVHVLHLNAGVGGGGPLWMLTEKDWKWILGVNLWGVIHGVRAFVPRMLAGGEPGHVVNTASMAGLTSSAMMGPYNVSKHGVVTLSETLQRDLSMFGSAIGVSVLCPGWVNTGIGDSGRNRPDELRNAEATNPLDSGSGSMLQGVLESGLRPEEVAGMVLDAVRTGRFYILTHPEWNAMIEQRAADILEGRTPTPMYLPT